MPETTVRPATARSPMDALRVHQAAFDSTRFRILSQEEVDHMEQQRCNYLRARKRILANLERLQSAYDRGVQLLPPMTRSPPPAPAPGASLARSELDSLTEELHNLEKTLIGHMAAVLGTYALEESLRSLWPSESDVNEST